MKKYLKHFLTILRHKIVVMRLCFSIGLFWQGLVHDNSKFSHKEFPDGVKYYQGDKSPISLEKSTKGYSYAWQHHHNLNPHHWEYWTDWTDGKIYGIKIPFKYVLEMFCDYISAGKTYKKDWNRHYPLEYFNKHKDNRVYHEKTLSFLIMLFESVDNLGLENTIKFIRQNKRSLRKVYENY